MSSSTAGQTSFSIGRVLIVVIPVAIVAVIVGYVAATITAPTYDNEVISRIVGLDAPVQNHLADQFSDADGDLIADAPVDPNSGLDPEVIRFSYVAVEQAEEYARDWEPFVQLLAQMTGKPVEYALYTSSEEQLRALRDGALHVTGLNTGSVPVAVNQAGFVPAYNIPSSDGTGEYRMKIIVPSKSSVESVSDLRDREFAFTHPKSNSGYKAAIVVLNRDFGMAPGKQFIFRFTGGHEESIRQVADAKCEAAAVASDMLERAIEAGDIDTTQYRTIYTSETFPTACLGFAHNLDPALAAKIREAFESFDWTGTALDGTVAPAGQTQFVAANFKDDWALIRYIDDATGREHKIDNETP